jgi:cytochrome b subunit of formate dehydrogenase
MPDATLTHERMVRSERIQHALLLSSFFTLVYTGFALKFPEAIPFAWLARLERGYAWRSLIHRTAAVVMVATCLAHLVYLFTRRGRGLLRDLLPRPRDLTDSVQNLLYLAGLRRTPPAFDRFGYVEKAEYWALVWGTVVMTATGLVLWFENQSLQWLPKWMLDLATLIHYYESWLAFLAIVVWHLYMVIMNPDVYPMNLTWITGRIADGALQHEHPLEWARMHVAPAPAGPAAQSPAAISPHADSAAGISPAARSPAKAE